MRLILRNRSSRRGIIPITANLELHLRSDLGVTLSGADVTVWADQSGNGRDFTQSMSDNRFLLETAVQNGKDALLADGTDDFMDIVDGAEVFIAQPVTIYLAVEFQVNGPSDTVYSALFDNFRFLDSSGKWSMNAGSALASTSNTDTVPHIVSLVFNATSSTMFIDGSSEAAGTANSNSMGIGRIAARGAIPSDFANVRYFEIAAYSALHDRTTQAILETYMNDRYAIF